MLRSRAVYGSNRTFFIRAVERMKKESKTAVIRDNELFGLAMIPLLCDWDIRRCNVKGCTEVPNTIITEVLPDSPFGLCENHFQEVVAKGEYDFTLVFDEFDAFQNERERRAQKESA